MRKLLAMCLVLVWACLPASHTLGQDAGEDNLVTVEVTGVGMSEAEAVNDALRKAVEEGAGTFIYSHSETEDFALVRDTVLARSAGFVQSKEVRGRFASAPSSRCGESRTPGAWCRTS